MRRLFVELFSAFSRALNVIFGGSANSTLSARAPRDGLRRTEAVIDAFFHHLPRALGGGPGHCMRYYLAEYDSARDTLAEFQARLDRARHREAEFAKQWDRYLQERANNDI